MRRTALITGASAGLGLALARHLAATGWDLVLDARGAERLAGAAATLDPGSTVVAVAGDVTDARHRRALAAALHGLAPLTLLVNNASTLGHSPLPAFDDLDPEVFRRVLEVNVVAPLALVRELAPHLGDGATVVNVSSDAAVAAYPTWGAYGASKAALDQASAVLAAEHPEWRVLAVDPGDMRTEMHQAAFPGEDISDRDLPETRLPGLMALIAGDQPSGRHRAGDHIPAPDAGAAS